MEKSRNCPLLLELNKQKQHGSNLPRTTMKKSLLTIFALAIAIGPALGEDEQDTPKQPKSRSDVAPAPTRRVNPPPQRTVPQTPRVEQKVPQNVNVSPRFRNKVLPPSNQVPTPTVQAPKVQAPNQTFNAPDQDAVRPPRMRSDVDVNSNWRNRTRNTPPP